MFSAVNFIVCTATATMSTKRKIFDVLALDSTDTLQIEKSPNRSNLRYTIHYVGNSMALGDVFGKVLEEVKTEKEKTCTTIIYC